MPDVRPIDANALLESLKESANGCREWKEEAKDEEVKIRADQARGTFIECALRVKHAPTIEADIDRAAILRLCNEIEMIIVTVCDTGYTLQGGDVEAIMKRTKAIRKELTGDAENDCQRSIIEAVQ